MSWFSRCSLCGSSFNSGNCRNCTNVSFRDEPVYDSNLNSYNQKPSFSNPLPYHNCETDSMFNTGSAFQAEVAKLQQNIERFMAQQSCSYYGGPFNSGNCPSCSIVRAKNKFIHDTNPFPYDNTPDFYDQPPQHHVETYLCELCGNDSHLAFLFTPLFDSNKDEYFDSKGDVDKINAFVIPSDFEDGYYDSEGDVLYLESFLSDDTTPNLPPEVFLYRDPRCLSKTLSNDRLRQSRTEILWGLYNNANVDYATLIWEDLQYQIDYRQTKVRRHEIMPYPKFTKVIIHYFMSQHKSISKREGSPYHNVANGGLLDRLKFVSKGNKYQVYRNLIPDALITDDIRNSKAYKMLFKYSTNLIPPKKSKGRAVKEDLPKKPTKSKQKPSKVAKATEEPAAPKRPQLPSRRISLKGNVIIQEPPHAPVKQTYESFEKHKGIEILSDVAQLKIDTLKAQKARRRVNRLQHQAGGLNEGDGIQLEVPDETKNLSESDDDSDKSGSTDEEFLPKTGYEFAKPMMQEEIVKSSSSLVQSSSSNQSTIEATKLPFKLELKNIVYEKMLKSGSSCTHKTHEKLFNALTWSIKIDESRSKQTTQPDPILKKRDCDSDDKDEDPSTGSNQGKQMKKKKKWKRKEYSMKSSTPKDSSRGMPPSKPSKSRKFRYKSPSPEPQVKMIDDAQEQPWFKEKVNDVVPPLTFDELMSTPILLSAFAMNLLGLTMLTRDVLIGHVFNLLKVTYKSYGKLEYNFEVCFRALTDQLDWTHPEGYDRPDMAKKKWGYGYLKEIVVKRADQKHYTFKEDFVTALKMFTKSIVVDNRVKDVQLGVESYQRKLNLLKPQRTNFGITSKELYTPNYDPRGVIYQDKLK
uniref:Uncharacterized protein n=1 Tax=Tanacetum cinerariifolium TaxID=118510 RepID=A0A6L2MBX4_TANCI|nr:hypothetical protein [Tanacetum cinerariifolium]